MSNSALVTYKHIVKNKTKGRDSIQKIFVHHMAGNLTVKQCGSVFDNRQASAHYGINGTAIGQYVDEADTAWHCGNYSWNRKSIGIELANDGGSKTNWHVSDTTIKTAIKLIADICKRNGITKLNYTGDMKGNLCMHRWVASTACPGAYLSTKFVYIASEVNKILGGKAQALDVDGDGGPLTVSRLQEFLGASVVDGEISGQDKAHDKYRPSLSAVTYGKTGSSCVKLIQKWVGVTQDGDWGKDTSTALQKKLGIKATGIFDAASMKVLQKYLNEHDKATYPTTTTKKTTTTTTTTKTNAQKLADKAKELAWAKGTAVSKYKYPSGSATSAFKTALAKAYPNRSSWGAAPKVGASCDVFVGTCVRDSGIDKNFPRGLSEQMKYKSSAFNRYEYKNVKPSSKMKVGDIVMYTHSDGTHIVIVGDGCYYEANYQKKYGHTNTSSRLKDTFKKVIILRAK